MGRGPSKDPIRVRLFDEIERTGKGHTEAARVLHISKQAVFNSLKRREAARLKLKGESPPMLTPKNIVTNPPPVPAPAAPPVTLPTSLDELLRGPGGSAGSPPPPPPPQEPPPEKPSQVEIDQRAADMGKELVLRVRGALARGALRYFAGVNPNDPRIIALLPRSIANSVSPKVSLLESALEHNPEKTQMLGGALRGWKGLLLGIVAETFDIVGTVRMVAQEAGVPTPEQEAQLARQLNPQGARPADPRNPAVPHADTPAPSGTFDLGTALGVMGQRNKVK